MSRYLLWSVGIVMVLWGLLGFGLPCLIDSEDQGNRGTFGDQFGAVNSLFSGLAFAVVTVTLLVQWRQLRDAATQQTRAITAQLVPQATDEIRSIEWGRAHDHLRLYHGNNPNALRTDFARRRDNALGQEHNRHRRVFLEPCYKVWNLIKARLVNDDAARVVLTPDLISTLIDVIEPLEETIRSNYDRSMFDWARTPYSAEDLASRGAYIHKASHSVDLSVTGQ